MYVSDVKTIRTLKIALIVLCNVMVIGNGYSVIQYEFKTKEGNE